MRISTLSQLIKIEVDVWSESDPGGISLTVVETNEATGMFEGKVSFTTSDESSGHRLRVSEGDTVMLNTMIILCLTRMIILMIWMFWQLL